MKKKISIMLSAVMLCTALLTTGVFADTLVDESMTIEKVDLATGKVTQFTV